MEIFGGKDGLGMRGDRAAGGFTGRSPKIRKGTGERSDNLS